jgi:putative nucleotidyltransferase with HDIG domain
MWGSTSVPSHVSRVALAASRHRAAARVGGGIRRRLPIVIAATAVVAVMPAVVAAHVLPARDPASIVGSALLAALLSVATSRAGAALWARHHGSGDVLFADLMVWGWLRRLWAERRLAAAQGGLAADAQVPIAALARLGRLLERRDTHTYGHSRRVARYAQTIARGMRLAPEEVERIRLAAVVHDIGKIHTPRKILDKPGRLTDAEYDVIKRHPGQGADMLAHIGEPEIVAMVRHHHERLDGNGYPAGLSGDAIPLGARIIAVADTFDALTSTRAYRPAATHRKALGILAAEAGTQLDGDAVAAFQRHYAGRRPAAMAAAASTAWERLLGWLGSVSPILGGSASLSQTLPAAGAALLFSLAPGAAAPTGRVGTPQQAAHAAERSLTAATPMAPAGTELAATPPARAPRQRSAPAPARGRSTPATRLRTPDGAAAPGLSAPQVPARAIVPETATPTVADPSAVDAPAVDVPAVDVPAVDVPVGVPAVTLPSATVPPVRLPPAAVPPVSVPTVNVPSVARPATLPPVTLPSVAVPDLD